jgi:uncharacterized protein (TIGR01777 family)
MKKILIAGGTGFIGKKLADMLYAEGHDVSLLSRNASKNNKYRTFGWDPTTGKIEKQVLQDKDIIINLAGSGIAKWPWTKKRKLSIYSSRILSTRLLVDTILNNNFKPNLFISTSAIGFYGNRPNEKISEISSVGEGFLSQVCQDWENEALRLKQKGIPVAILRLGIVLSDKGGSLPVLLIPFRYRLNVLFNRGLHTISWIHIDDLLHIFSGIVNQMLLPAFYNAVSPNSVSQKLLNEEICRTIGRKTITIRIPERFIKIVAGEMVSLITYDQNIAPNHLLAEDFTFKYPEISGALKNLFLRMKTFRNFR